MYLSNGGRPPLLDVQVLYWKDCEADWSWRLMSLLQTFKKGDGMNGYHRIPGRMQPSLPTHIHGLLKWVTKNFPFNKTQVSLKGDQKKYTTPLTNKTQQKWSPFRAQTQVFSEIKRNMCKTNRQIACSWSTSAWLSVSTLVYLAFRKYIKIIGNSR